MSMKSPCWRQAHPHPIKPQRL